MTDAKPHLLLVEDDSLIAFDIAKTLETAGCVSVAIVKYDPDAIIASIGAHWPDLVLLEICQWQEDRLELMRRITDAGIAVIAGTVCDEYRDGVAGFEEVPVLIKPYDPQKLLALLENVLAPRQALPEITSQMIAS